MSASASRARGVSRGAAMTRLSETIATGRFAESTRAMWWKSGGRSLRPRMWSMASPTVQSGGAVTISCRIMRPALCSG